MNLCKQNFQNVLLAFFKKKLQYTISTTKNDRRFVTTVKKNKKNLRDYYETI